jgi:hypothetical protein
MLSKEKVHEIAVMYNDVFELMVSFNRNDPWERRTRYFHQLVGMSQLTEADRETFDEVMREQHNG